jgi:chromosome segregation ATPase
MAKKTLKQLKAALKKAENKVSKLLKDQKKALTALHSAENRLDTIDEKICDAENIGYDLDCEITELEDDNDRV